MPTERSRYAARLRKLGCNLMEEKLAENGLKVIDESSGLNAFEMIRTKLTRKKRRQMTAQGELPFFFRLPDLSSPSRKPISLSILLENGEVWQGPLDVEQALLKMGFKNVSDRFIFEGANTIH